MDSCSVTQALSLHNEVSFNISAHKYVQQRLQVWLLCNEGLWIRFYVECMHTCRGVARYKYNHAIPVSENSVFKGEQITKQRRVSVISRTQP